MGSEVKLSWILERPNEKSEPEPSPAVRGIRPRRVHTKSRNGCGACKHRRKKVCNRLFHRPAFDGCSATRCAPSAGRASI